MEGRRKRQRDGILGKSVASEYIDNTRESPGSMQGRRKLQKVGILGERVVAPNYIDNTRDSPGSMGDSGPVPEWLVNETKEPPIPYKGPVDFRAEPSLSPPPPLPFYQLVGSKTEVGPGITSLLYDHTAEGPKPELIGEGSFGKAMLMPDKQSVVKIMEIGTKKLRNVFHREVYALRLLGSHPNIVALKGWREDMFADDQGKQYGYLEIEYAEGTTVRNWLANHKDDRDLKSLWYPFVQTLLLTIEYIHRKGVHHLDLHPSNVMIHTTPGPKTLKVIDFGMSCSRNPEFPENAKCGRPGNVPYYTGFVSTETASEKTPFTAKDMRMMDLWSVGALAHLWWFGYPPYAEMWQPPDAAAAAAAWMWFCSTNKFEYPPTLVRDDSENHRAIEAMRQLLSNPLVGDKEKGWVPGEIDKLPDNLRNLADPGRLWPPQPS